MGALPAAPLASIKNVSLVELSPSTVTWLKLRSATALTIEAIRPASTAASVVMYASIVAMFGWIMPEPLHIPPTLTRTPPRSTSSSASLGCESVVMIACAASSPCAASRSAHALMIPDLTASIGM